MDIKLLGRQYLKLIISILSIVLIGSFIFLYLYHAPKNNEVSQEKNVVVLKPESAKMAGIEVTALTPQVLTELISAPGEVIPNANLMTKITTRISAQVEKLFVQEGEHVKVGQPLIQLSSVEMAKTQGDLLLAAQEWMRTKNLGKDAVSAKRYSEAQVVYQRAYSTALAYGMTEDEINNLLTLQKPSQANGEFKIFSPREGVILNLNVADGELTESGKVLLEVVEEKTVWIEAKLSPDLVGSVRVGDVVYVTTNDRTITGYVTQIYHQLDETTRTRAIRIEAPNLDDFLHPGQFVNAQIESSHTTSSLAVPVDALMRVADGGWAIYIEKQPGHFQQVEVKILEIINNQAVIEGIPLGTRVVTKGAFFVHAELNKSAFDTD